MVQITEGKFKIDGVSLFTKTWLPGGDVPPKAKMIMFHGFSDHIGRYYDFFPYLASRGIAVYGVDQRGWGKSAPTHSDKGRSGPTTRVLADMAAFVQDRAAAAPATAPVFVCGHSMGGGQVMALASSPEHESDVVARVRGWILEAPFLGFAQELQPNWLTIASGKLASHVLPGFKMHRPIPPEDITRDPDVQRSIADDALCHNYGTLEGLAGMLDRTEKLSSGRMQLSPKVRSLLLAHGTGDKATSFDKSKAWFERQTQLQDKEFKAYEGVYHQIHADHGKEVFYEDVANWILARCDGDGPTGGGAPEAKL
ncbi:Uu.00g091490.m01.CDS01 [Anthostomella pinea]|uniref:Uu.00g091490.m01.CDS01 n=1 Tax=Anthostomella pinea TaxID=933095 RepID=A0AAI8VN65_9PEZI|nr:Uu.00g091490.m01.CDS01 [Anthostomella pinea]